MLNNTSVNDELLKWFKVQQLCNVPHSKYSGVLCLSTSLPFWSLLWETFFLFFQHEPDERTHKKRQLGEWPTSFSVDFSTILFNFNTHFLENWKLSCLSVVSIIILLLFLYYSLNVPISNLSPTPTFTNRTAYSKSNCVVHWSLY